MDLRHRHLFLSIIFAGALLSGVANAAAVFEHEFAGSSTGTATISVGQTISFEAFITIDEFTEVGNVSVSFTGDIDTALATDIPCPGPSGAMCFADTANRVTDWMYSDVSVTRHRSVGLRRRQGEPAGTWLDGRDGNPGVALGSSVFQGFTALFGNVAAGSIYEGSGVRSLMGTVTIRADRPGTFNAGVLVYPGVTGVYGHIPDVHEIPSTVHPGTFGAVAFTVLPVPEPGTALLLSAGLVGFAVRARKR